MRKIKDVIWALDILIKRRVLLFSISLCFVFLYSCNTTKYVPDGEYLLDKVSINVLDKTSTEMLLMPYVQQTPNGSTSVGIYNLVNNDSNFFKKAIRKLGAPAIIYKNSLTELSVEELTAQMRNIGYLNAEVTAKVDTTYDKKKASVTYTVIGREPYRVRNFKNNISILEARPDNTPRRSFMNTLRKFRNTSKQDTLSNQQHRGYISTINEGSIFDMNALEIEINRVTNALRNRGYYNFTADKVHFLVDTALMSNQVDITMVLSDSTNIESYTIKRVNVYTGFDPAERDTYVIADSVNKKGINIYYNKSKYLRPNVIANRVLMRPDDLYRDRLGNNTFNLFQSLSGMGRVDIQYEENNYADSTLLDCNIFLTPGNNHSVQLGVEGTNKAGDLGVALDVTYGNANIFNGGEIFNVNFRTSYEFVRSKNNDAVNNNFYEIGVTPSFTFPRVHLPLVNKWLSNRFTSTTTYSLGYNIQRRPEFTRNFFNFNWKFGWTNQSRNLTQSLTLLDVNYVNMPWVSDFFKDYLSGIDPLTRYSYDDVFTAGLGYSLVYTNAQKTRNVSHKPYTIRFNAETSGNALSGLFSAFNANKSENGKYNIMGNPFAQYVKGNIEFSQNIPLSLSSKIAYRVGLGVAYPYGNSSIMPFEKRYFAGGPNSVRGWSTRYLGPGSFNSSESGNIALHVGDINFITTVEYRQKLTSWFEPAIFIDAGNIWTIKEYESQPNGYFQWDRFYKEIAVATGIGLRFDLSFLVVRLDAGTRVYDPARTEGDRFVLFRKKFLKNSALHFAIGYPF
ncbi:outer membrane protein assembly factor BamA [Dysgonomonadaceae bacterium PH5-43]|nr:outer membrane protein assembly factor BamA [Dysgonomonadaceae bacterium PH5-43]